MPIYSSYYDMEPKNYSDTIMPYNKPDFALCDK